MHREEGNTSERRGAVGPRNGNNEDEQRSPRRYRPEDAGHDSLQDHLQMLPKTTGKLSRRHPEPATVESGGAAHLDNSSGRRKRRYSEGAVRRNSARRAGHKQQQRQATDNQQAQKAS